MMADMKHRLLTWTFAAVTLLAPVIALAKEDEESALKEARLEGYPVDVRLPDSSPALTWFMMSFLAILLLASMLKNAKRTHLD